VAQKPKFQCNIRASFAIAFRNWRVKHHIPLWQIPKDLGLAVSTVSSWEMGERRIREIRVKHQGPSVSIRA